MSRAKSDQSETPLRSKSRNHLPSRGGIIFILSAPSGAGKTTISRAALKQIAGLEPSISVTTRAPRDGEVDGIDYHFVSKRDFTDKLEAGEFAEWAQVFEHRYGTPRKPLDAAVASGCDILLDIDIQGASQIRRKYPRETVTIFVMPPSFAELQERLKNRGTESAAAIRGRLKRAREEARAYPEYDYLIVNAEVNESLARLEAVVTAERLRVDRIRDKFVPWKN